MNPCPLLATVCLVQATQEVVSRLPLTTPTEFNAAVAAAKEAFPAWRATPVPTRARVMLKLQQLIRENWVGGAGMQIGGGCTAKCGPGAGSRSRFVQYIPQ
jgi:delta 1-pyrroline-5-carboxylate dehydrogenase